MIYRCPSCDSIWFEEEIIRKPLRGHRKKHNWCPSCLSLVWPMSQWAIEGIVLDLAGRLELDEREAEVLTRMSEELERMVK